MVLDQTPNDNGVEATPDDVTKIPRLPRWTRQEILVLIQGKRVAESRVRRGRVAGMGVETGQVEPKWAAVSSYCKRHGVNRGAVQCRKRWSNLAGDYKKIKEWETQIKEETESFWVMRNDLRRERKLPGFFDREVYDILDGNVNLALATPTPADVPEDDDDGAAPTPISEKFLQTPTPPLSHSQGTANENEKQAASNPETGSASQEGRKRKRATTDGEEDSTSLQNQLIEVLEKNGKMVTAQLEAQNTNFQLDREQRKDHTDSIVAVLDKLANALGKIADKL